MSPEVGIYLQILLVVGMTVVRRGVGGKCCRKKNNTRENRLVSFKVLRRVLKNLNGW